VTGGWVPQGVPATADADDPDFFDRLNAMTDEDFANADVLIGIDPALPPGVTGIVLHTPVYEGTVLDPPINLKPAALAYIDAAFIQPEVIEGEVIVDPLDPHTVPDIVVTDHELSPIYDMLATERETDIYGDIAAWEQKRARREKAFVRAGDKLVATARQPF
jgi:hypothetical protein